MSGTAGNLRLSILIEAIDRISRPLEQVQARIGRLVTPVAAVAAATQRLGMLSGARVLAGTIGNVATRAREATSAVAGLAGRMALLGAGGAFVFNQQFVRGAADFERYRITLETVMGSADAAQRRLAELTEFAARTPFNVAEVVRAGVALQTLGIRGAAADRALTAVGDAASIFGTSLSDAMTAFNAALRGEMDPIERFGIQARTEGERLVMQWEENGRRMRATVDKNNRAAIAAITTRALRGIAGGGMQRLAESWDGMVSNLGDAWQNFARRVAENGPFDFLKDQLRELLAWIDRMKENGSLERWAQETGAAITSAFRQIRDFVIGTDEAPGVLARLQRAFEVVQAVLAPIVARFGGLETALVAIGLVIGGPVIAAVASLTGALIAFAAALLLTPAGWFLAAVMAIGAAAAVIISNWSGIADFFGGLWDGLKSIFQAGWDFIKPIVDAVIAGAEALASILPDRGSGRTAGGSGPLAPQGQGLRRRSLYGPAVLAGEGGAAGVLPPANDVRVRAGIEVDIRLPDGVQAGVTQRGAEDGLALSLRRGMMVTP